MLYLGCSPLEGLVKLYLGCSPLEGLAKLYLGCSPLEGLAKLYLGCSPLEGAGKVVSVRRVAVRCRQGRSCLSSLGPVPHIQVVMGGAVMDTRPLAHYHLNTVIGVDKLITVVPAHVFLVIRTYASVT